MNGCRRAYDATFRTQRWKVISAGNRRSWRPIREFATTAEWAAAAPDAREAAIINALDSEMAARTLPSPAEGLVFPNRTCAPVCTSWVVDP